MNYEAWAQWYDTVYATDDSGEVEFYVDLARDSGGPVLEIGCGTGRIVIPTARAGVDATGIDRAPAMLDRARRKLRSAAPVKGTVSLIEADMRDFDLRRQFPLVTLPARTLLLATTLDEQRQTLACARRHLAPGGRLVFNAFVPHAELLSDTLRSPFYWDETINPDTGRRCLLWALNRFDALTQTNDALQIVEELDELGQVVRKVYLEVRLRYLHPPEVALLLDQCGLETERVLGDFSGSPLDETSDEMIWIARLPAG